MSDSESSELGADDFGLENKDWLNGVEDSQQDPEPGPPDEKSAHHSRTASKRRDYSSESEAIRGGEWSVSFKAPTESHPFHEIALRNTAPLAPQSGPNSEVWCGTMNDSLKLEYLSSRGNILCQCLTSFRPGLVDDQNQKIWDVVKEFALLNQTFVLEVSKQQSKLNVAMARLGSTAFRCSDQLENMMDITMAVAPFEEAVMQLKNQSVDLVTKNDMLGKEFTTLTKKVQDALIGDVAIEGALETLFQSAEELTVAREKYLKRYAELNADVTEHKCRVVQLEQQLKDMKYSFALLSEHLKLLDDQTQDSETHNYEMTKKATLAHDYFYERKRGDKVVYSYRILREAPAKETARRSEELKKVTREDSQSTQEKLDKLHAAKIELQQEHTSEKEKGKEAETALKITMRQLKKELDQKEHIYDRNLQTLQIATERTGVVLKNLPLFLKALKQIHFYNTGVQNTTNKVLDQVQVISEGLDVGLRGYRLWDKPLSKLKGFGGQFKPMVRILYDKGIEECGELAPFHNDERQMEQLMKLILPELRKNHKILLDGDGRNLSIVYQNRFKRACKQMAETPGYLLKTTKDIGGYLSISFKAFKQGQKSIKKPSARTLQIELEQEMFLPGREMLAIKDKRKHDRFVE